MVENFRNILTTRPVRFVGIAFKETMLFLIAGLVAVAVVPSVLWIGTHGNADLPVSLAEWRVALSSEAAPSLLRIQAELALVVGFIWALLMLSLDDRYKLFQSKGPDSAAGWGILGLGLAAALGLLHLLHLVVLQAYPVTGGGTGVFPAAAALIAAILIATIGFALPWLTSAIAQKVVQWLDRRRSVSNTGSGQ